MKPLFVGLDLGTSSLKGLVCDTQGQILARARIARLPVYPHPGWVEMDAQADWWEPAARMLRGLVEQVGPRGQDILAVGVSGMVPCLCLLDENGAPLRPAILYSDNRALAELDWVRERTGLALNAQAVTPKLLWVRRHEPEVFARARMALSAHNYVVLRLCGQAFMDYDTASILGGVFRAESKTYRREAFEQLGLPDGIWPELRPAPSGAGSVTRQAALETGLPEGALVLVGSGDTFPGIVGCGAIEPGDAAISIGTSGLLTLTERPLLETALGPHFEDGSIRWAANILTAGETIHWFQRQLGGGKSFEELDEAAARIPAGADGLVALPHWQGRRTPLDNPSLRGALIGLTPGHEAAHVYRALLEGFAYNIRQGFDPIRASLRRLSATGGGAASGLWRQILADVLDMEIEYSPRSSSALGIAFLAAWASGAVHDFDTVSQVWLRETQVSRPNPDNFAAYRRCFRAYQGFDRAIAEASEDLWDSSNEVTDQKTKSDELSKGVH